jgi:hypothetical protein
MRCEMERRNDHIAAELERIGKRLEAGPDPFEHAGLYAAQQALCWAAQPEAYASPFAAVTGSAATQGCCSEQSRPTPS